MGTREKSEGVTGGGRAGILYQLGGMKGYRGDRILYRVTEGDGAWGK